MQQRWKTRRGGCDGRPRQGFYPMWGIEDPYRETNIDDLYRYNEVKLMNRYIVPPSDVIDKRRARQGRQLLGNAAYKLLKPGIAVEDVVVSLVIIVWIAVMFEATFGPTLDVCMDKLGW